MDDLFGKYCYIDTPWIAGEKTRYRIIGSGVRSNSWCEVPVTGRTELIHHDNMEEVVFVILDTLVGDDSIIRRFALKDVDVIPSAVRPVRRGKWTDHRTIEHDGEWWCTACGKEITIYMGADRKDRYAFCPNCGAWMEDGDADG